MIFITGSATFDGTATVTVNIGTGIYSSLTYYYSGRYDCPDSESLSLSLSPPNCVLVLDRPWYSSERVRRSEPYLWKPESVLLRSMSGINIDNAAEREYESYFYRFTRILINSSESIPIHPLSRASWTWTKKNRVVKKSSPVPTQMVRNFKIK